MKKQRRISKSTRQKLINASKKRWNNVHNRIDDSISQKGYLDPHNCSVIVSAFKRGMTVRQFKENETQCVRGLIYHCISPRGKIYTVKKLGPFCKRRNLSYRSMISASKGGIKRLRNGWRCIRSYQY